MTIDGELEPSAISCATHEKAGIRKSKERLALELEAGVDDARQLLDRRAAIRRGIQRASVWTGVAGLVSQLSCRQQESAQLAPPGNAGNSPRPPIVLITLDTTRARSLGCYGYSQSSSPNIDRFAQQSLVYDNAIAPGTWTLPSHASLFTGKFPSSHGARKDTQGNLKLLDALPGPDAWAVHRVRTISQNEQTLASILKSAGYLTGAVVAGPWMMKVFGLSAGFDFYDEQNITDINGRVAEDVTDVALDWLKQSSDRPRFLFLNYFDPHYPLVPPEEFLRRFVPAGVPRDQRDKGKQLSREHYTALYDAEISYMDHHVGRLLDGLRSIGHYDSSWIIMTSDHGHLMGEHGKTGHGGLPYQEVAHIPMIVKAPGTESAGQRSSDWIQLTDVLPMIAERLQLQVPATIQGQVPVQATHPIVIESIPSATKRDGSWLAIIEDGLKFIWNSEGNHMLFDLNGDPSEENNLFPVDVARARSLGDRLVSYLTGLPKPGATAPTSNVDQSAVKALKSVGYLD